MTFKQFISKFHHEESGQDMLEYAMVLLAVLAAVVAGTTTCGITALLGISSSCLVSLSRGKTLGFLQIRKNYFEGSRE